jgi:hypothetical protein
MLTDNQIKALLDKCSPPTVEVILGSVGAEMIAEIATRLLSAEARVRHLEGVLDCFNAIQNMTEEDQKNSQRGAVPQSQFPAELGNTDAALYRGKGESDERKAI